MVVDWGLRKSPWDFVDIMVIYGDLNPDLLVIYWDFDGQWMTSW